MMVLMLMAFACIGYFIRREDFGSFLLLSWFACFGAALLYFQKIPLRKLLFFAIACRAVFIFSIPVLSDDYFRFLWDGHILNEGINPFLSRPASLVNSVSWRDPAMMKFLFDHMNSPGYYSVYPPIMQAVFAAGTWLFPASIKDPVIFYRFLLILSEIGTIYFLLEILKQLEKPVKNVLFYALNPLVIIELSGNLHFEAIMLFFLAMAIYFLNRWKPFQSGIALAFSIGVKLIPLMFAPILLKFIFKKRRLLLFAGVALSLALLFLPLINFKFLSHFFGSIGLYFHSFEFNGSFYKLFRWLGYLVTGQNIIYIWAVVSPLAFLFFFFRIIRTPVPDATSLLRLLLLLLTSYFLLASIVHPWYITTLIFLNVFLNYRYVHVWSVLIFLTYSAYTTIPVNERPVLAWLEYLPVVMLFLAEFNNDLAGKEREVPQ